MIRRGEEGDACHFDLWVVVSTSRMATISVIVLRCTGSPYSHRIDPHNDARRKAGVAQQNPSTNLTSLGDLSREATNSTSTSQDGKCVYIADHRSFGILDSASRVECAVE